MYLASSPAPHQKGRYNHNYYFQHEHLNQYKHLLDECADSMVTIDELKMLAEYFFRYNVAIVAITMGQNGAFLQVNDELEILETFSILLVVRLVGQEHQ